MPSHWNNKDTNAKHHAYKAKKMKKVISDKKHSGRTKRKCEDKDDDTKSTHDKNFNIEMVQHKSSLDFDNPNIKCYDYENENTDDDDDYDPYDDVLGRLVVCDKDKN